MSLHQSASFTYTPTSRSSRPTESALLATARQLLASRLTSQAAAANTSLFASASLPAAASQAAASRRSQAAASQQAASRQATPAASQAAASRQATPAASQAAASQQAASRQATPAASQAAASQQAAASRQATPAASQQAAASRQASQQTRQSAGLSRSATFSNFGSASASAAARLSSQSRRAGAAPLAPFNSSIEQAVINARQPLALPARDVIQAAGWTGLQLNREDEANFQGPVSLKQFFQKSPKLQILTDYYFHMRTKS
jgi:hypothetical protein